MEKRGPLGAGTSEILSSQRIHSELSPSGFWCSTGAVPHRESSGHVVKQILHNYVSYRAHRTQELDHPCPWRKDSGCMYTTGQNRGRLVPGLSTCSNGWPKSMEFYSLELAPLSEF